MTTPAQIKHLIPQGETTTVQFKIRSEDAYKMGVEMVAFSNTQGGMLIIGINDKTGVISVTALIEYIGSDKTGGYRIVTQKAI